jgi:UDP-N-acetylmuramoyl-tripeptide--D-alanyl-D-alanine ligase
MSYPLSLAQLCHILNVTTDGIADPSKPIEGITTDTRELKPGQVFVALRGEKFDGHDYIDVAIAKGALVVVLDTKDLVKHTSLHAIYVPDTLQAYQAIAHWWRNQFTKPVIAVTGSVGKTTTKELIAAVLATRGAVLKSQANFNNEIGVPKTLLQIAPEHDYTIIEMGMRGRGEIALLSQLARPDIAVITNVGTAHIGRLGSEAVIAQAKCELLAEMPSAGVAVLNYDNPLLMTTAATIWRGQTVTFGLEGGDIHGELVDAGTLRVNGILLPLPLPGRHNALNYLAALTVAQILGMRWDALQDGLSIELPGGRARRYDCPNDVVLLDETYNAGLESMIAALQLLATLPGQRRIAVLGTMKELGERSPEFHHRVGQTVRDLNLDSLLILADEAETAAMSAGAAPLASEQFLTQEDLLERLTEIVQPGDRILFKASRTVALDQVVTQFRQSLGA